MARAFQHGRGRLMKLPRSRSSAPNFGEEKRTEERMEAKATAIQPMEEDGASAELFERPFDIDVRARERPVVRGDLHYLRRAEVGQQ